MQQTERRQEEEDHRTITTWGYKKPKMDGGGEVMNTSVAVNY
jgi:hypothetical protein